MNDFDKNWIRIITKEELLDKWPIQFLDLDLHYNDPGFTDYLWFSQEDLDFFDEGAFIDNEDFFNYLAKEKTESFRFFLKEWLNEANYKYYFERTVFYYYYRNKWYTHKETQEIIKEFSTEFFEYMKDRVNYIQ